MIETVRSSRNLRRVGPLALILCLYLMLGTAYSLVNPPFEGYDEQGHSRYVVHLATERYLSVMTFDTFHESWQPPLYYVLNASLFGWIDTSDLWDLVHRSNPHWAYEIGSVGGDNKNMYLHGPWENFPYQKTILALHAMRGLSVLLGAVMVIATYLIAAEIFPRDPYVALGATAFAAFTPQILYIHGSVTNDSLVTALMALTILVAIRCVRTGWTIRTSVLLGGLAALTILTKLSGLIVLPLLGLCILANFYRTRRVRPAILHSLILGSIVFLGCGWWFVRNRVLYGDWTGMEYMRDTLGRYESPLTLDSIAVAVANVHRSYWAFFGSSNVPVSAPIYQALQWVTILTAAGLALALYRHRKRIRLEVPMLQLGLALAWMGLTALAVAYYISGTPNANMGRNLFVAAPALSLFLFLGLVSWCPQRLRQAMAWGSLAVMVGFALLCLVGYIAPAYAPPPVFAAADPPAIFHPLYVRYANRAVLRGYDLDRDEVHPGDVLRVTLYWEPLQPIEENYSIFVQVTGQKQQGIGQRDTYPGLGNLPTSQWQPNTVIADTIPVPISPQAQTPVLARIDAGLYTLDTLERLPTFDEAGNTIGNAIGYVKLSPTAGPADAPAQQVRYDFGNQVALVGYTVKPLSAGQRFLHVTLYWQTLDRPALDYTIFLHLLDAQGQWVASNDNQPLDAEYPFSSWAPGELVADPHRLSLQDVAPGQFELWAGLYDLDSDQRLPVYDVQGQHMIHDQIPLGTITVQP